MYPSLVNLTEVRSPLDLRPFSPYGFAFAITSLSVFGTVVTGTVPALEKLPEMIIF